MPPLKVLHLNTYSWGGAAKASIRLHQALLKHNIQSKMLFLEQEDYNIPASSNFKDHLAKRGIYQKTVQKIKEKLILHQQNRKLKAVKGNPNLFKFSNTPYSVESHPLFQWADIIHLHWVANFINPSSFSQRVKQPIFWTFHDLLAISGGYHYESDIEQKQYKKLIAQNQFINNKSFAKRNIQVICPSQWMLENVESSAALENASCFHIPNGIDTDTFSPLSTTTARRILNLSMEKKIVLFIAGNLFDPRKGFSHLWNIFSKLKNNNIQLACVGNKYNQQLPEEVIYLGNISDERLMRIAYAAADVTVLPSLADNLPNTAIESILCGTPLLTSRVGGLPEIVNKKNGMLFANQDHKGFAKAINTILERDFDRASIRQEAKTKYSDFRQIAQLIPLYKKSLVNA